MNISSFGTCCARCYRAIHAPLLAGISAMLIGASMTFAAVKAPPPLPPGPNSSSYQILPANDLGMHCDDSDLQIFTLLPPFNVLHAQVIQKGNEPFSNPRLLTDKDGISVEYFSSANPNDPVASNSINTTSQNSKTLYKSNFWDINPSTGNTYAVDNFGPLYPLACNNGTSVLACYQQQGSLRPDMGLPAPDTNTLPLSASTVLYQQSMPGISNPYKTNQPQAFARFDADFNFFKNFPQFGQVVSGVNWFAADGLPITYFDDAGRMNAYPLMRVQVLASQGSTLAATDMVAPVSSEASCQNCHLPAGTNISCDRKNPVYADGDGATGAGPSPAVDGVNTWVLPSGAPGANCLNQIQNSAKLNILLLHDSKNYQAQNGKLLYASRPLVCASCHYSPALDLTQVGPGLLNAGVNSGQPQLPMQLVSRSMSGAIHSFHATTGSFSTTDIGQNCYMCHPGPQTKCLRGVMANPGGRVCFDCHGQLDQVGNDFTVNFPSGGSADFTKRVPWANEPKCQSCHTGDAVSPNHTAGELIAPDGIRLLQAYLQGDPTATPISSLTSRFAENASAATSAGNYGSILYRLSTGHGGVFCEGCHGSTHAEWPNATTNANDNLTATELQGHSGKVIECDTCHTGQLTTSLDGPHGVHPIGDQKVAGDNGYSQFWVNTHGSYVKQNGLVPCEACHGVLGQGTVLSVVAAQRTLTLMQMGSTMTMTGSFITLTTGEQVSCDLCHASPL
jgi:hypothetical protein